MSFRKRYTDQDIIDCAKEVKSISQLLKKLGLRPVGGNYCTIKRKLQNLNINCSHFTGKAWSKDQRLKDWSDYGRAAQLKPHIIKDRGHKCEDCGLPEWKSEPIVLEIHHKDGDRTNNRKDNLQLLCPNCHSSTHNWRGRSVNPKKNRVKSKKPKTFKTKPIQICKDCPTIITKNRTRCKSCAGKQQETKIDWPDLSTLKDLVKKSNYTQVGKKLGVSDNAIRKHIKNHS